MLERNLAIKQRTESVILDPVWCAWLSGFIDGEGYFSLRHRTSNKNIFHSVFEIQMREDDEPILIEIQNVLGVGSIIMDSRQYMRNKKINCRDACRYGIYNNADIVAVIFPLLDIYPLRSRKHIEYQVWRDLTIAIQSGEMISQSQVDYFRSLKR